MACCKSCWLCRAWGGELLVRPKRHPDGMTNLCGSSPTEHRVSHAANGLAEEGCPCSEEVEMLMGKTPPVNLVMDATALCLWLRGGNGAPGKVPLGSV